MMKIKTTLLLNSSQTGGPNRFWGNTVFSVNTNCSITLKANIHQPISLNMLFGKEKLSWLVIGTVFIFSLMNVFTVSVHIKKPWKSLTPASSNGLVPWMIWLSPRTLLAGSAPVAMDTPSCPADAGTRSSSCPQGTSSLHRC